MQLTQTARQLRERSTDAERLFWSKVRAHRLNGHKFKRQQPLGRCVADFVCMEAKLVVELDGGQHADSEEDKLRDAWLQSEGYRVLRFWNNDVLTNIDGVLMRLIENLSPSPQPSPLKGEGVRTQS
jgi:very-short-patch-repair endonuclease